MSQRRVENTRVHFWTFLPVSVKDFKNANIKSENKAFVISQEKVLIQTFESDFQFFDVKL